MLTNAVDVALLLALLEEAGVLFIEAFRRVPTW